MVPIVSILIPIYNVERYLPECLDSIVKQTYNHIEVIMIDDGSSDDSLNIAQTYCQQYPFMSIYHQENQGVATTRNHLLQKATGDFVLFVDSDDWIEPETIEFLIRNAILYDVDIVTCAFNTSTKNEATIDIWEQDKVILEFLRHKRLNGSLCNKLIKREIIQHLSFATDISYGEDALFVWQALQSVKKILVTNKSLYNYRRNEQSISHQKWDPDRKGSGHKVWDSICRDTRFNWPQFESVALARFALEDMWGLYFAALSDYPYDSHIEERQLNIRKNIKHIRNHKLDGYTKYLTAVVLCRWYGFGKILKRLFS